MGNRFSSSDSKEVKYLKEIALGDARIFKDENCPPKVGGAEGGFVIGGYSELKEYDSTVSSKSKKNLVKKLAVGISKAMKVSQPSASAGVDELVAHLIKITPNPRKGKSVIADKTKQAKLCNDIADVVNKAYDKNIVDKSLGPDGICNQVADLVDTLSAGINQEYVAVAASVSRNLQNLVDLQEMLGRSYDKLYAEAMSSDDEGLKLSAGGIKDIHDLLTQEVSRQIAMLTNLTNTVVKETDRDIVKLLADNRDFKGLVTSLKSHLGSSEWGDRMGYMLSGVGGLSAITAAVEKALKTIGVKVSDYKKAHKLSDLMMVAHEKFEKMPDNKISKQYLEKYYAAIDVLRSNHGRHSEISKKIKGGACGDVHVTGSCEACGGSAVGGCGCDGGYSGGRIKLAKRLKKQKHVRLALLKDFKTKAKIHMDRVYQAIFRTGKKLTSGKIPLTDDMYRFKALLNDLTNVFGEGAEYALASYYTDSSSTRKREHFIGIIQGLLNTLGSLKSLDTGFKEIAAELEAVLRLMDFYADKFKVQHSRVAPVKGGEDDGVSVDGLGVVDGLEGVDDVVSVDDAKEGGGEFKAVVSLRNARNTFNHYYNIAKFKKNLDTVSSELSTYNKDYTEVVGVAVGQKVNDVRDTTSNAIKSLRSDDNDSSKELLKKYWDADDKKKKGYSVEHIEELLKSQLSAKEDLYKVAQAVDEYLQKFTDGVAAGPEDVQEVAKLLSSVELVSNWFSEKSGDAIASLFELFPWRQDKFNDELIKRTSLENPKDLSTIIVRTRIGEKHYYEDVKETLTGGVNVANVSLTISPERAVFAHKFAKYAVEKMFALKNIVSAFAYLGQKFGGEDLTKSTFLAPNEMYKKLCKYLYTSAYTWVDFGNNNKAEDKFGVTMSMVKTAKNADRNKSIFKEEDEIFINIIKAMAAKVFTVTGLYNMMNFSSSGGIRNYALSPTRVVLGGGSKTGGLGHFAYSTPKIYADAVELYARLPLLAEFYRDVFCYEEACDNMKARNDENAIFISMVPEVGSLWAGFIATIFDQPINTNGLYTDNVLKRLIHEINQVYVVYKNRGAKDITSAVISDFVAEINSRYGVMKVSEIRQYRETEDARRRQMNYENNVPPDDDYDILDEDNIGTGVAPSDRYARASSSYKTLNADYKLDDDVIMALREFRRRIDNRISSVVLKHDRKGFDSDDYVQNTAGQSGIPDFNRIISSTKASLGNSKDPNSQFGIVRGMMLGMDVQTQTNVEASVMFHEAVVAPLNILTAITNMLQKYSDETLEWDAASLFKVLRDSKNGQDKDGNEMTPDSFMNDGQVKSLLESELEAGERGKAGDIVKNVLRKNEETFKKGYMGSDGKKSVEKLIEECFGNKPGGTATDVDWSPNATANRAAYIAIRLEAVFKHLVNAVYGLTADTNGLCEVSVSGSLFTVNHTGLQSLCEQTVAQVRSNIDKFRGIIDSDIISKYLGDGSTESHGSLLWVHDKLIANLFDDADKKSGLKRAHRRVTESLQLVSNIDPTDHSKHVTDHDLGFGKRTEGWCVEGVVAEMTHYNTRTMSETETSGIAYDSNGIKNKLVEDTENFLSEDHVKVVETKNDAFAHLMRDRVEEAKSRTWSHPIYKQRINMYLQDSKGNDGGFRGQAGYSLRKEDGELAEDDTIKWVDTGAGLQVKFNEVMAKYISQFWDQTSLKIYSGLIEGPSNGPLNNAVFKAQGHPDLVSPGLGVKNGQEEEATEAAKDYGFDPKKPPIGFKEKIKGATGLTDNMTKLFGRNDSNEVKDKKKAKRLNSGDPTEVLYASLSKALRTALTETSRSGVKVNIIHSIAEVPLRMKEDMKAQLPVFASQFKLIAKRAELLRSVLRLPVGLDRVGFDGSYGIKPMRGVYGSLDAGTETEKHDERKRWNIQWLDKITSCCDSMITTIRNVMTELNDAPLFFEVNEDSITNYKNRHGSLPVMPLSQLTLCVAPAKKQDDGEVTAEYRGLLGSTGTSVGDNNFMFNYGVRLVLNDDSSKPLIDHMPGVVDILQKYNMVTPSNYQLEEKTYGDFATKVTMLARYAGQTRMYASLFGADRRLVEPTAEDKKSKDKFSYQLQKGLGSSIDLTTSSDSKDSFGLIGNVAFKQYTPAVNVSRSSSMVYNLLDLNISPINVHAMRREIPLANLYNYAYTFDSFVTHIVQSSHEGKMEKDGRVLKEDGTQISTHDVMSALCKHPYIEVREKVFWSKLENLVSGNSTLGFYGYPRFIADQLWGKVLLQNTVVGDTALMHLPISKHDANERRKDRLNIRFIFGNGDDYKYRNDKSDVLTYNKDGKVKKLSLDNGRHDLAEVGRNRFDTKFIRNMFFLANVQRIMLYKINTELTEMRYPVATDLAIANKNLTDARDGQTVADLHID